MATRTETYAEIWRRLMIADGRIAEALNFLGALPDLSTGELMLQRALQHAFKSLSEAAEDLIRLQKDR